MAQKHRSMAAGVVLGLWVLAGVAGAQGQSQGRGRGNDKPTTSTSATVVFRDSDHATFRDYFLAHKITAEPLPPGIAKNVARGKPLPPGIAKRAVPADLVALGPKLEQGTSLAIVGDVVIATKGGLVIDIMAGVFKR